MMEYFDERRRLAETLPADTPQPLGYGSRSNRLHSVSKVPATGRRARQVGDRMRVPFDAIFLHQNKFFQAEVRAFPGLRRG